MRTYICWQIYESAFLLKWGKLLLLLLLLLPPPPPPSPPSLAVATAFCCRRRRRCCCRCYCCCCCRCYCYYYWISDSVGGDGDGGLVEEKAATARGVADEEKERGSIRFTPTRDLRASPRPLLSEPPHLYRSRGESRAFYPSPFPLAPARPPSRQTFLLILSFAISPSISHWCNFPVGDLYDVKICVVYLATMPLPLFAAAALIYRNICRTVSRIRPLPTRLFSCRCESNIF